MASKVPWSNPITEQELTLEEQLRRLDARGLRIEDLPYARQAMASIGYYRLKAYWLPFLRSPGRGEAVDAYKIEASFEQVLRIYEFDRKFRLLVLDALERVEVLFRTAIAYHLGHKYGAMGHEDPINFHPKFAHKKWVDRLHDETRRSRDPFIREYVGLHQDGRAVPIWVATEVMSLGSMSRLYWGLHHDDKRAIAVPFKIHPRGLANWLHVLTYIRNVCAHHSRLWNRELSIQPAMKGGPEWQAPVTPGSDRAFCVLLILRHLLRGQKNSEEWASACEQLVGPFVVSPFCQTAMGFPNNWTLHPIWTGARRWTCLPTSSRGLKISIPNSWLVPRSPGALVECKTWLKQ